MRHEFEASELKVERAHKHLTEFYDKFSAFSRSDFYSMRVEKDPEKLTSELCIDMDWAGLEIKKLGPIVGDILHNLRSALDIMYEQVILLCEGKPTAHSRFPIFPSREKLENCFISSALKQRQIRREIADFIVDEIRPYNGGNEALWGLHELNVLDKHKALIPFIEIVVFVNVRMEDERGERIGLSEFLAERTSRLGIIGSYRQNITLKDKGQASANVIFPIDVPAFRGQAIFPALMNISKVVSGVIEAFDKITF